jgi:carbamoyl-phosphate synthase small subunit
MKAVLSTFPEEEVAKINEADLLREATQMEPPEHRNLVAETTCREKIIQPPDIASNNALKIAVIDCGVKASIIRELTMRGCRVIRLPYNAGLEEIKEESPAGILISNGPGDPAHPEIISHTVRTIRSLITQYPIMGICLGHQILALVFGARTYKRKGFKK